MKDHEVREAINELSDIAIKHRDSQCLREAIVPVLHGIISKCRRDLGIATNTCDVSVWPVRKFKNVEELKVGDKIRIVSTELSIKDYGMTRCAKILEIVQDGLITNHELHFEGTPSNHAVILDLGDYQTEYEVI